jgi:hypothetical protein
MDLNDGNHVEIKSNASGPEGVPLTSSERLSQRENILTPVQSTGHNIDQQQRKDDATFPAPANHSDIHARPGWNASHRYGTRLQTRLQANLTLHSYQSHNSTQEEPIINKFTTMTSAIESIHTLDDGTPNYLYPWALQNDVLHYGEMLAADDRDRFVDAMKHELDGLQHMLQVIPCTSIPHNTKPLPAVWAFKHKRFPDWSKSKYKARLNMHGGKQTYGVNYWETYAPVVNWTTVWLTMILSILHGYKSHQVDFIQAFTQAPLDCPGYMEIRAGYTVKDGCLTFNGENCNNQDKTHV